MPLVNDIIRLLEQIAPNRLAEDWDNAGLQIGSRQWRADRIMIALDPLLSVVKAACEKQIDLLITHHPLIFSPLKQINFDTPQGEIFSLAANHRLSVIAAHTNLDSAAGGLNDLLASKLHLHDIKSLVPPSGSRDEYKLALYVPADHFRSVLDALFDTPAGKIGNYTHCTFSQEGTGTFKPGPDAVPRFGVSGQINFAQEVRIEANVAKKDLNATLTRVEQAHPYETMAYDLYPLFSREADTGLGRVGKLEAAMDLSAFADDIKSRLGLGAVRVAGATRMRVQNVAVCTGSGAGLLKPFFASNADVFVTGDLRYHDAQDVLARNRGLVDIGHFASEHLMVEMVKNRLEDLAVREGYDVTIEAFDAEADPFEVR